MSHLLDDEYLKPFEAALGLDVRGHVEYMYLRGRKCYGFHIIDNLC